jgi:hypothetical protein
VRCADGSSRQAALPQHGHSETTLKFDEAQLRRLLFDELLPVRENSDVALIVSRAESSLPENRAMPSKSGPVAQLGARFHGMEEVVGSIPTRSTIYISFIINRL